MGYSSIPFSIVRWREDHCKIQVFLSAFRWEGKISEEGILKGEGEMKFLVEVTRESPRNTDEFFQYCYR